MDSFAAIDFETANRKRDSACSVGLAVVRNGRIVDRYSSLVKPCDMIFDADLINIHGITAAAVEDAPRFTEIWGDIESRCRGLTMIAHNAAFDIGVLSACAPESREAWRPESYFCTYRAAKVLLPGLPNHKLHTLANLFGIGLNHHDALSDAVACAEIALRICPMAGPEWIGEQSRRFEDFGQSSGGGEWQMSGAAVSFSIRTPVESTSLVEQAKPDGRFSGERFVFTGNLAFLSRTEAKSIVEEHGGQSSGSVSKKTTFVVVGDEVLAAFEQTGKTTGKLGRAVQLRDEGTGITIINESKFLDMIQ